jgi:hypothetical protein
MSSCLWLHESRSWGSTVLGHSVESSMSEVTQMFSMGPLARRAPGTHHKTLGGTESSCSGLRIHR